MNGIVFNDMMVSGLYHEILSANFRVVYKLPVSHTTKEFGRYNHREAFKKDIHDCTI